MNPGLLDRLVIIELPVVTRDSAGGVVTTWSTVATVWGRRVEQGGREFRAAGALHAETTALFTLRFFSSLTAGHRLQCEGRIYDILAVNELGRREFQLVQTRHVEAAA